MPPASGELGLPQQLMDCPVASGFSAGSWYEPSDESTVNHLHNI